MMRILLDCRMASWSGVGRYTRGLARALARRDDIELVQVVADTAESPVREADARAARYGVLSPLGSAELGRIVRAARPDLTHCPHYPTPFPTPHPLVVSIHDLGPLLVDGVMPSAFKRAVYRHWNEEALRFADRVIVPSAFTQGTVERFAPEVSSRIRLIADSADDFTDGEVGALPAEAAAAPYVLSMGNTKVHKDLPTLLRAFASVAADRADLRLLLVGADQPGFVASTLGSAAGARVAFTGPVDDAVLRALYASAAVFAFPSRFEGFGLPPLEAMALGAPVVAADAASLPEVTGDAALLFAPGDDAALASLLARVLDDPAVASDLRERGRARAAAFTWDATAERTVAVYREVLAR